MKRLALILLTSIGVYVFLLDTHRSPPQPPVAAPQPSSVPATPPPSVPPKLASTPEPNSDSSEKPELRDLADELANDLYRPGVDFAAREDKLRKELSGRNQSEWLEFIQPLLDHRLSIDGERAIVYLLGLADETAIPALAQIALAPVKKTNSASGQRRQIATRLECLEHLDILAITSNAARARVIEISTRISTRDGLRPYAEAAALGIRQGTPGKLHRLLEETLRVNGG